MACLEYLLQKQFQKIYLEIEVHSLHNNCFEGLSCSLFVECP